MGWIIMESNLSSSVSVHQKNGPYCMRQRRQPPSSRPCRADSRASFTSRAARTSSPHRPGYPRPIPRKSGSDCDCLPGCVPCTTSSHRELTVLLGQCIAGPFLFGPLEDQPLFFISCFLPLKKKRKLFPVLFFLFPLFLSF